MRMTEVGRAALLIECADGEHVEAWRAELWRRRERGELSAIEIVPGARTVLLDGVTDPAETARRIAQWPPPAATASAGGPQVTIPVVYDGSDLPWVAEQWGLSAEDAVDRIASTELRVAFCGFSPGFAYLAGLPADWAVPRLSDPRPKVPAGSVGLAGEYAGIYPTSSPGGWRLIGRTEQVLFDVDRDPPALLVPGTRVRLVPA
ncbi:5-oxoprolinase subunit B family protein [Micromonospora sp. CPCC 206061]|uniref:5-oxoprolinase subunit B family protein n=1 Tax=Micromonospora sp. CPCC 206061 TaxID=3122410 RepID=UPI002FF1F871